MATILNRPLHRLSDREVPANAQLMEQRLADPPSARRSTLNMRLPTPSLPTRVTGSLPALASTSTTSGPTRPDIGNAAKRRVRISASELSAAKQAAIEKKVNSGLDRLHPVVSPTRELPALPSTLEGLSNEVGCHREIISMFGDNAQAHALADKLLAATPMPLAEQAPYKVPLILATGLHAVFGNDAAQAESMIDLASRAGESPQLFQLSRILASSGAGKEALSVLLHAQTPAQIEQISDQLTICSDLEKKGFPVNEHASIGSVVQALSERADIRLEQDIGSDQDAPMQLLAKALLHAHAVDAHVQGAPTPHKAAFVAWKKGGFTESGAETNFNKAIAGLHKFSTTYVDRGDHGDRNFKNLAHDLRTKLSNIVGHAKSPLSTMREGTLGGDLGLLHEEAAKYKERLHSAISVVSEHLIADIKTPAIQEDQALLNKHLAKAAILDLWRGNGESKLIRIEHVMDQARAIQAQAGGPADQISEAMILKDLRKFTSRTKVPHKGGGPTVKIKLAALEEIAADLAKRHPLAERDSARGPSIGATEIRDPAELRDEIQMLRRKDSRTEDDNERIAELQTQRLHQMGALVAELRAIKHGGEPRIPLFKLSDIKGLLGGEVRQGPTKADSKYVMHRLASAKYESMSSFSSGGTQGANAFGAIVLKTALTVGVPIVYPILSVDRGQKATVTVGVSNTGGRLFVGKESPISIAAGIGGGIGWSPPAIEKVISSAALASASLGGGISHGEGVCITTRNDVPDWADKLPQVVDFMFNQAHPSQEGIQRPQSPTELWNRFVDKFGDDPGVALSWNSETSKGISPQANATGVARVITSPKGGSVGPTVTAGLKHDRNNFQRIPNTEGGDVPVAVSSTRTSVSVTGAISHARTGHVINESKDWGLAVPIMGITAEWNLGGGVGVARLGRTRDGLVSPGLSHREFIFREPKKLIEYANLHRAGWEAALVAQDPTKSTTPEIARERFNTFIEQIASAPPRADRLHGELMTLDPIVADQINNYEARFNALLGKGDAAASSRELTDSTRAECNRLQNEIHRLLKEDSSWKHAGIYGVEISQKNSEKGINFGLKAVGKEDASSARLTALLIAGLPKE